jgi:hypothetical protein
LDDWVPPISVPTFHCRCYSTALRARKLLRRSAVDSIVPSIRLHADSLVVLIIGIRGTFARLVCGTGHQNAACCTCYTEEVPRQRTNAFRAIVTTSSYTHAASNHHSVGRFQPMIRSRVDGKSAIIASLPESAWRGVSFFTYSMRHESEIMPRLIFEFALRLATISQCLNPHGWGFVIAIKVVALPNSESVTLLRGYALQDLRPGVLIQVDKPCSLAGIHPTNALLTLERPASLRYLLLLYIIFKWAHVSLSVLDLLSLGAVPRHTRRESRVLWPPLLLDKRRSWRSKALWPTVGRATVRVEQPSIGSVTK